jgi:biopolymer transport protein ExbD
MAFKPYETPTGLPVGLESDSCRLEGDRPIVLRITNAGQLFINQDPADWKTLTSRFSAIFGMREHRTLYLLPEDGVLVQTIADAVDIAENAPASDSGSLHVRVSLITPKAMAGCLLEPTKVGSRKGPSS